MREKIAVVDYGSQTTQLVVREIKRTGVYAFPISPKDATMKRFEIEGVNAVVLAGGPNSVYDGKGPELDPLLWQSNLPVLGICFGHQLMAHALGGVVEKGARGEYARNTVSVVNGTPLFYNLPKELPVWMNHFDVVKEIPEGFVATGLSESGYIASMSHTTKPWHSVQFHPELDQTVHGRPILENFTREVAKLTDKWKIEDEISRTYDYIDEVVRGRDVVNYLSGGVDSTVATLCLIRAKAAGKRVGNVYMAHVDNGLMRQGESKRVITSLHAVPEFGVVDLIEDGKYFLAALRNVRSPERKRNIIGDEFINTMIRYEQKKGLTDTVLCQGTIHPDLVESGHGAARKSANIKTHHNVGSKYVKELRAAGRVVEPNRELFKDDVREVGKLLGLPDELVHRQPFPGPGLAIRIVDGAVTEKRLDVLRRVDNIFLEEVANAGLPKLPWQYFMALLNCRATGQQGDERRYGYVAAVRAVTSRDAMSAGRFRLPQELEERLADRIPAEVREVTRVVVDVTSKPPGTIEFE